MKGHTLVLAGELDRFSAPVLETEIERLCGTGVVALTLDLRELSEIDSVGVAVIVHRSAWCARRGCDMTLLADPGPMRHAFALGDASERVTFVHAPTERPASGPQAEQQEPAQEQTARPQLVRPNAFAPPGRVSLAASTAHVGDEDARSASLLRVTGRRARARARRSRRARGRR
ncbi:MAG: STAS domain-containing protein [Solirubrobacterales bacterium]